MAGAQLARSGSGSVVPASEGSSVSPPRARKVAVAQPPSRVYRYKYFDVAFNDGTKSGGGRMLFIFGVSSLNEKPNFCLIV